jgi:hypothetical protein
MIGKKPRFVDFIYWLAIVGADVIIFMIFGVLMMSYEDSYDRSKSEYGSLPGMNMPEKIIYISYIAWLILNAIGIIYIVRRIYKRMKFSS